MELKPGDHVLYSTKIGTTESKDGTLMPKILFQIGKIGEIKGNIIAIENGKKIDHRAIRCKFQEGVRLDYPDFDMEFVATGKPMAKEAKEFLARCKEREKALRE